MRRLSAGLLSLATAWSWGAMAAPLEPAQCDSLKSERETLATAGGLAADLERGPEWGKANLSPDRLRQIQAFIELEEKIAFRCPRPKPPPAPAVAQPGQGTKPQGTAATGTKKQQKPGTAQPMPGVTATDAKTPERKAVKIEVKKPAQKTVQKPAQGDDGDVPQAKPAEVKKPKTGVTVSKP